jgi:putative flippase GtrA
MTVDSRQLHPVDQRAGIAPPTIDVVIPVYNETRVLAASVRRLHEYLSAGFPFSWRITIADNASTDSTWELARELAVTLPGVRAVEAHEKGRGLALRTAWRSSDAAVLVYMDVDLSTALDALLPLVAPLVSGHSDVAVGSRLAAGSTVARGPRRELISRGYNAILRAAFSTRITDAQCGFKAIRADVAKTLMPHIDDNEWFFDTEMLLLAEHNGLRVHEVPVTWIDDPDSRVDVVRTAVDDLRGVARMTRRFSSGRGTIDFGVNSRPALADDFGRQVATFALVGAMSTAVSLAVFLALRGSVGAIVANVIAVLTTTVANSWANRRYTFGRYGSQGRWLHYLASITILFAGLAFATIGLALVGDALGPQLAVIAVVWSLTALARFALLRRWIFRPAT